jgi:16S rRNA (cytidine1402-2'-O)-methyltransferase
LQALALEPRTLVFFEAPHRIEEVLSDCAAAFGGGREAAVARELTKLHESVYRGTLAELARRATDEAEFKLGEITLVVAGATVAKSGDATDPAAALERRALMERTLRAALPHLQASKAASIAAAVSGVSRDDAYARAIELAAERR